MNKKILCGHAKSAPSTLNIELYFLYHPRIKRYSTNPLTFKVPNTVVFLTTDYTFN